jgi:hypothetical protein
MITVNMTKAKQIAHTHRRDARALEFAPLDLKIASQIPGLDVTVVETQRQTIRDKYAAMQQQIDSATNVAQLEALSIYQP